MNELLTALLFGALVAAIVYYVLVKPLKMQIARLSQVLTILTMQREAALRLAAKRVPAMEQIDRAYIVKIYEDGIRNFGIIDRSLSPDIIGVVSGKTPIPLPEES